MTLYNQFLEYHFIKKLINNFYITTPIFLMELPSSSIALGPYVGPLTVSIYKQFKHLDAEYRHTNSSEYPTAISCNNRHKNRYSNVLPNEKTRVKINQLGGCCTCGEDYINANKINVKKSMNTYIVSQAPLPYTFHDFWKMVWEQNTGVICMLTRLCEKGRHKADVYWPDVGQTIVFGDILVKTKEIKSFGEHIVVRLLNLWCRCSADAPPREVWHLHYMEWPDNSAPTSSRVMRDFIGLFEDCQNNALEDGVTGFPIVHCSAGIGRAGTFVGILFGIEFLRALKIIDLEQLVREMRCCRDNMVQTMDQYKFMYFTLAGFLANPVILAAPNSEE